VILTLVHYCIEGTLLTIRDRFSIFVISLSHLFLSMFILLCIAKGPRDKVNDSHYGTFHSALTMRHKIFYVPS
jgi:hypothetical protein